MVTYFLQNMKFAQHALAGKVEPKEIISIRYKIRGEMPYMGSLFFYSQCLMYRSTASEESSIFSFQLSSSGAPISFCVCVPR